MHSSRLRTARSSSCLLMGGLPQYMLGYPPGVGLETPQPDPSTSSLGVGLETPRPDPSTSPLGVGLETSLARPPNLPPWVWAWRPPPCGQTDTCKNITFTDFVCWR